MALEYPYLICSSRYTAKPQIAIAMLRVPGVSVGSARLDEVAAAGAAAHHAPAGVAIVFVRGPLPDIAGHVVDTVWAGSLRVAAHLAGPAWVLARAGTFVFEIAPIGAATVEFIAAGLFAAVSPTRRLFPFVFTGQAAASKGAKGVRFMPVHVGDRQFRILGQING